MTFYERAAGLPEGHSSYFESPHRSLDPNLFDGTHLLPQVRQRLLVELEDSLNEQLNLSGVESWLHAWLAGSGITYQWEGGEGDLDVLFGVDMTSFVHFNPNFTGIPESAAANWADDKLRQDVWPRLSNTHFGRRKYEVTFYWNPGTGNNIERIKPYAAYDLKADKWVVEPPKLGDDPAAMYPDEWFTAGRIDGDTAAAIVHRHGVVSKILATTSPGTPDGRNARAEMIRLQGTARGLFDDIHLGRRQAFGEQGHGYSDWHNFRWQHAKATGVISALRKITDDAKADDDANQARLYGGPIDAADTIITREMMRYGPRP